MNPFQSVKEEVRRAADIVDLIGQYVKLRKVGRNHVGLCPFHAEKAPSFTVSPERQTFHCFGCKKGGDIFAFWMEYHGATFPEALRDLAERYNVSIPETFSSDEERKRAAQREALFKINESAALYFEKSLMHSGMGKSARDYLAGRSITPETMAEFRLGYAPDQWEGLTAALRKRGVELEKAELAGLIIRRDTGGYYDRFRGRIVFPIFDLRNRVVGFGGRVLDDSVPKYLNTPETPIFRKGETLYGLHASHKAIRKKQRAVMVEGYMDCLALRNHGLEEVVATLGTALTERHIRKLKGYASEVVVVFDSDEAGIGAMLKSLPLFLNEGVSARAAILPDGHDPDSFVNTEGLDSFLELLAHAPLMFDLYLEQRLRPGDSDPEVKIRVLREIIPILSQLRGDSQRLMYGHRIAERMGVRDEVVWSELRAFRKKSSTAAVGRHLKERVETASGGKRFDDLHLLNLLVHYPEVAPKLMDIEWQMLVSDPSVVEIFGAFFKEYSRRGPFSPQDLLDALAGEGARQLYREVLMEEPHCLPAEVDTALLEIGQKALQKKISASIKRARERGDIEGLNQLLKLKAQGTTTIS
ncbi:MAG: DNA primase [Thermoplasmata archaeon]|nr:MAG: DNA primase [Thermoplasmata archaeon]